jgi:membrane protein DedA with SNARE-associated domain
VRSLISVPAGIARMHFGTFLLYSLLGTAVWNMLLLFLGYVLESQYDKISVYIDFAGNAIIISFFSIYAYRVITYKKRQRKKLERRAAKQTVPPVL